MAHDTPMDGLNCLFCAWWYQPHHDRSNPQNIGWCKRHAPTLKEIGPSQNNWPTTLGSDWCGDWKYLQFTKTEP